MYEVAVPDSSMRQLFSMRAHRRSNRLLHPPPGSNRKHIYTHIKIYMCVKCSFAPKHACATEAPSIPAKSHRRTTRQIHSGSARGEDLRKCRHEQSSPCTAESIREIHDAGERGGRLAESRTGVIIGCCYGSGSCRSPAHP